MNSTFRTALLAGLTCAIVLPQAANASQVFGEKRVAVRLCAPIRIADCIDGQAFSAKVLPSDDFSLPEDATVSGHLRIITPDFRAAKNQQIALKFETLNFGAQHLPISANMCTPLAGLEINCNGRVYSVSKKIFFDKSYGLGGYASHCFSYTREEIRKDAREREKSHAALKKHEAENARYNLTKEYSEVFLSTKACPFALESSDIIRLQISSPIQIPDYPKRQSVE